MIIMVELKKITDLTQLLSWRKEVIENVFGETPSDSLMEANKAYYEKHIPDETHIAFIALYNSQEAGSGSICLSDELPSPDNPSGRCAYLMNIYVRPEFRERGLGHAIVRQLLTEAQNLNCGKIYLETTEDGRRVYESLGFREMPDMMKYNHHEN